MTDLSSFLDSVIPLMVWVVIAWLAWVLLRNILKIAAKVFVTGCAMILVFGGLIWLVRHFF
jgi:hypothetical protein